jgi:DNA-binding CsgD family transcriptional regulator
MLEHKMEQTLENFELRGLELLLRLKEPFLKEWSQMKNSPFPLISVFDELILYNYKLLENPANIHPQNFILSLTTEWQKRFPILVDENQAVFLFNIIENIFHKHIAEDHTSNLLEHQSLQTLFSKMLDHALFTRQAPVQVEKWFQMWMDTALLQVKWIAIVKKGDNQLVVDNVVCNEKEKLNIEMIPMCRQLKASNLDQIAMALPKLLIADHNHTTVSIVECLQDTLLLGSHAELTKQQQGFVKRMYLRQLKMNRLESKVEWKDAALLFLQRLLHSYDASSALEATTSGLVDYLHFKRSALFFYSPFESRAIGVSGHYIDSLAIQEIKEDIEQLPFMQKYLYFLQNSQPFYIDDAADLLPYKYVQQFRLKSLVVIPLFIPAKNKLLGIALLDQGEDTAFQVTPEILTTLIKFGQYAGEFLYSYRKDILHHHENHRSILTKREREVLERMAEGDSISEAADKLSLSSYTVRDYISSIIHKLQSRNRTEAVVKAVKMKLIG